MKTNLFKVCLVMLCAVFGWSNAWAENYATWTFASGTAGTNYPSNNTAFTATSGSCGESTYTLNGSGSQWNATKGYAFTAITDMAVTVKLTGNLAAGSSVVFAANMYYNKASNAPMTGFTLTVSENKGSFVTTGLSATSLSLSTSNENKSVTYTTQTALKSGDEITLKYTQTGKAGAGQGYVGNITVDGPAFGGGSTPEPTKYNVTIADGITNGTVTANPSSAVEGATVTLTATPAAGYELDSWSVTNASTSETISVTDDKFTMPAADVNVSAAFAAIPEKTIAEFITSEGGKCYLTGIVSNIKNTTYGNFDLTDESGTIYVYGCLTSDKQSAKFNTLDVVAGDKIKVLAESYEFYNNTTHEAKNVIFVEEIAIPKPKYTVTIVAPANGTLVVKEGDNVLTSGDQVEEGKTLTVECTPTDAENYRYQNWQYKEDGDWVTMKSTMTRVVSQDIAIRANFELIPVYTVAWSVNGTVVKSEDLKEGAAVVAPADPADIDGKTFTGWVETSTVEADATPEYVTPSATATKAVTYYAVFATYNSEATPDQWQTTSLSNLTSSDVFVMASGTKAISSANGTSGNPVAVALTVSAGKITSEVTDAIKWTLTGNATDGYTFYKNGSSTYLYVNTTAASGSNTCIRVGTQSSNIRNNWKPDTNGYLKTNDSFTARYLSFYSTGSDFRGYINTSNGAFAPTFYKFVPGEDAYSEFTTTVSVPAPVNGTLNLVAVNEDGYWATFSSTENVIFDANDVIVYTVAVDNNELVTIEASDNSLSCVTDKTKDSGWVAGYYVQAGAAVLINAIDASVNYYFIDTDEYTPNQLTDVEAYGEYNMLKPASEAMTGNYSFYKLAYDNYTAKSGLGFYWGAENGGAFTCKAGTAYLAVPKIVASNVRGFSFDGGVVTSIKSVENKTGNVIYDLSGRRVNRLQQGVNIVNGKKVIR